MLLSSSLLSCFPKDVFHTFCLVGDDVTAVTVATALLLSFMYEGVLASSKWVRKSHMHFAEQECSTARFDHIILLSI